MEAQPAYLRAVDDGKQVTVRVLPSRNGLHTAMRGPFSILMFDDAADPDLVYVERPDHVDAFKQAFGQMRTHHTMDQGLGQ